jgi:hypothetical protein
LGEKILTCSSPNIRCQFLTQERIAMHVSYDPEVDAAYIRIVDVIEDGEG